MNQVRKEAIARIERQWLDRAKELYPKPKSMAYKRAEVEFFTGAMTAIDALYPNPKDIELLSAEVPAYWVINALSGRPIVDPEKYDEAAIRAKQTALAQNPA